MNIEFIFVCAVVIIICGLIMTVRHLARRIYDLEHRWEYTKPASEGMYEILRNRTWSTIHKLDALYKTLGYTYQEKNTKEAVKL